MFSYLSWSKFDLWQKSKSSFIKRYIYGESLDNKYLRFGKKIAEGLEDRDTKTKSECVNWARQVIPCPKEREKEYFVNIEGVPIYGKLDGQDTGIIHEYKTGKNKWTQKMVDNHGQLTFYAMMMWKKTGKLPDKIFLYWLQTYEDENGEMKLAKLDPVIFQTKRTITDIAMIIPKIKRTWKEINSINLNDI